MTTHTVFVVQHCRTVPGATPSTIVGVATNLLAAMGLARVEPGKWITADEHEENAEHIVAWTDVPGDRAWYQVVTYPLTIS